MNEEEGLKLSSTSEDTLMKLLFLLLILVSQAKAQTGGHEYQMKGLYSVKASNRPVEYTLEWTETQGQIKGEYRDNFFANKASVKGSAGERGRSFTVSLPETIHGVRTLHFLTARVLRDQTATTIPVSVISRDSRGNPVSTVNSDAQFVGISMIAQRQEEEGTCTRGFGELAGFCGIYNGLITEQEDRHESCELLNRAPVNLELSQTGDILLHLGSSPSVVIRPVHEIGRIPTDHGSTRVDVLGRSCRPLLGIGFQGDDECKILNLRGNFVRAGSRQRFLGTYTVTHESTRRSCRYGLTFED